MTSIVGFGFDTGTEKPVTSLKVSDVNFSSRRKESGVKSTLFPSALSAATNSSGC
jgi:hypothetical protein